MSADLLTARLQQGAAALCRCWAVQRTDGTVFGFTDHDRDLAFDGIDFRADSGMSARALTQSTGLSVDNTEALGALSDSAVTEADIVAGRFDGAEVRAWLVDWTDVAARQMLFRGQIGELTRSGGAFTAELRGLTEALNQPQGRVYQAGCSAVLGDAACKVDLAAPGYVSDRPAERVEEGRIFHFADFTGFDDRWFEKGRLEVLSGAAKGLVAVVKNDRLSAAGRAIELWESLPVPVAAGDLLRITAGCDKRAETCRLKFHNLLNFRGFPDIPGEDWLTTTPQRAGGAAP
ncbi:gene transfer agent protein [Defluviimonas sp. 20V17]|uniref:Bacteriophage phiJL001 Gp84 C-terminal domain-containing protein n=1 Tax=Allgaiera indica TaxID=765699 RepID=A0AAN4ZYL2_9RHOB|nr:DUF2163 domain-containing protein [Allgaiera indica]KDB03416.1 gene transfer agent protein [Defluviimonas sp. 20V17]GHE00321.1 hypothetical protein GCM10008024_11360 [Allgaiera indica]SDW63751.1 phage conserved hypothetical protein BR0599 [Allgaiera indica]